MSNPSEDVALGDVPAEIFSIRWETIRNVLWSEEEFDGIEFGRAEDGSTIVYAVDPWGLNLYLLALARVMSAFEELDPRDTATEYERTYHALALLTMGMSLPSPAPDRGDDLFGVKLPCIRITGLPGDN